MEKVLVIGAGGQLGVELTLALREKFGRDNVIASDIREPHALLAESGPFIQLDVMNSNAVAAVVKKESITQIYLLAAILSATGEKNPLWAWDINMKSLMNVLDICVEHKVAKLYWPSSIAVFGNTTPKDATPQKTVIEPTTVYGISKYAGELWCQYYFEKYGLDVRSMRYPGLISWKSAPGGGTTDYAIDIYIEALKKQSYECFLSENTYLPMMYMDDAVRATLELMDAPKEAVKNRMSYNLAAMSFSPVEISEAIKKRIPEFTISYAPDFRQQIADSWPSKIDDSEARKDWGWKPEYDLEAMTDVMLEMLKTVNRI
ncbi:MAG: NAD-dependent epimerase/dehydratase family protein [Sphingobacteriales bacterium]|nr:MAG: NAD-dependent epimerase/dehydratase family protein [Sphingobacteriales bacterium]